MKQVTIYTDGSCLKNPGGAGGWAAILVYKGVEREVVGGEPSSTNNRAEMMAALVGLETLNRPCHVTVVSDSNLLVSTMGNGWKRKKNLDLWARLDAAVARHHHVAWEWVRGHNGHPYNERCDRLAERAAQEASALAV